MLATLTIDGPLATLTLNRPEQRNALSIDLLEALHARVDELAARTDVTAAIVTGAGKAFCAGMDLKQVLGSPELAQALLGSLAELTYKLRTLPCVTLAVVHGAAIGGGCGLTTVCDLSITHAESKMGFPEVDLGVCPAVVGPWLCKKIGVSAARRVLLSGGLMSGLEAHREGIVTMVAGTREELDVEAAKVAARLATGAPGALRATKALMNEIDGSLDREVLMRAARLSADVLNMPQTQAMLRSKLGA